MARKNRSNSGPISRHNETETDGGAKYGGYKSIFQEYPTVRRCVMLSILVWIIGVPIPSTLFFSLLSKNSDWLPLVYQSGLFGFDSRQVCMDWMGGTTFQLDKQYYQNLQLHLNLTDEQMFDYLQQWMCVVPPDDDEGYKRALQSFSMDYLPLREYFEDGDVDREGTVSDGYLSESSRWKIDPVYHEVESEPLHL